jgi:predicted ATP-grasp superfamily ATP-dependent carboligase
LGYLGGLAAKRVERAGACAVSNVEVVRALGAAGIGSAVVAPPGAAVRLSRFATEGIDPGGRPLADVLVEYGSRCPSPPALFYDSDAALLQISRNRDALAPHFRFLLPAPDLLEDLVDKRGFQALSDRLGLPVPPGQRIQPATSSPDSVRIPFPLVLKPIPFRDERWDRFGERGKVIRVEDAGELERLWPRLAEADLDLMAQEVIPGGETDVLSYHVYVDSSGEVTGEFTGRKLRTYPLQYGMSSALVTTSDPPLMAQGRELVERLGLRGPAKLDFKRTPDGRTFLLEVNPRFTLWVHSGALAGVNLAALAYADLTQGPRPAPRSARAGVCWIHPKLDLAAARESGVALHRWAWFAARCESNHAVARNDPGAALRRVAQALRARARRALGR